MRLATFDAGRGPRAGVAVTDDTLVAASELAPGAPDDMIALIAAGDALHARLRESAARASGGTPVGGATLLAPIPRPRRNVFCVGWNYSEHFQEGASFRAAQGAPGQQEIPEFPALFSKNPATVTGPESGVLF